MQADRASEFSDVDRNAIPRGYDYASDPIVARTDLYLSMKINGSFVDPNGSRGVAGDDVRVMKRTGQSVNLTKVMGTYIPGLEICTVGAVVSTTRGTKILVMEQYAYAGSGKTVHSCAQIKRRGHSVHISAGFGFDHIGIFPSHIRLHSIDGNRHFKMRPYTDKEWETMEIMYLTSPAPWHTDDILDMVLRDKTQRDLCATQQPIQDGDIAITKGCVEQDNPTKDGNITTANDSGERNPHALSFGEQHSATNNLRSQESMDASNQSFTRIPDPPGEPHGTPPEIDDKFPNTGKGTTLTDERGVTSLESEWIRGRDSSE